MSEGGGSEAAEARAARPPGRAGLVVDGLMMALLVVNLTWLVFEATLSGSVTLRALLQEHLPGPFGLYDRHIHQNATLVDMVFVTIFVGEVASRWALAVVRGTYHRWFFYPLVHWYDVVGCIPFGALRFLRVLRLIVMVDRMQRAGLIDVRKYYLYRVFNKYKDILTEEISDRVVLQVLDGVQDEVTHGSPMVERVWTEVVTPHKDEIAASVTERAEVYLRHTLDEHQPWLHAYVDRVLDDALDRSHHAFRALEPMPFFGPMVIRQIEDAIKIIVNNVIAKLVEDAKELELKIITDEVERAVADAFAQRDLRIEKLVQQVVYDSLDIVKEQVEVQQWKIREAAEATQTAADREAAATPTGAEP